MFKKTAAALAIVLVTGVSAYAQGTQPATPARPGTAPAATTAPAVAPRPATAPAAQGTLVNLNTATIAELDKLPQIGDKRAADIAKGRPYKDWNDFVAKKIVPSNAEAAIKDKVRFR